MFCVFGNEADIFILQETEELLRGPGDPDGVDGGKRVDGVHSEFFRKGSHFIGFTVTDAYQCVEFCLRGQSRRGICHFRFFKHFKESFQAGILQFFHLRDG